MKKHLHKFTIGSLLAFASTSYSASVYDAWQAATYGPEQVRVHIYGHHWNVKPACIRQVGNRTIIDGQISHNVHYWDDDQIYYDVIVQDGKVLQFDIQIENDFFENFTSAAVSAVGLYFGYPVDPATIGELENQLEAVAFGDWEGAAQKLATQVGLELIRQSQTTPFITAFPNPQFSGECQTYFKGVVYDGPSRFSKVGNDKITSLQIPEGLTVLACEHTHGAGFCQTFTGSVDRLDARLNDKISYLSVY